MYNNQKVGAAFEKAVGQAFSFGDKNTQEFHSSVRSEAVIPDFVGIVNVIQLSSSGEIKVIDIYGTGLFIEAKTSREIGLDGSTKLQMKAMVDVCSNQYSMGGSRSGAYGVAALYLVTPSDSKISPELIKYATEKHVLLYHFKALYDKDDPYRIKFSTGKLLSLPYSKGNYICPPSITIDGIGSLCF